MENPAMQLRRLNPYCARALEGAASRCQTRTHAEILPKHWPLKLLEQGEGDLSLLNQQLLTYMATKQKPVSLTLGCKEEEGVVMEFGYD